MLIYSGFDPLKDLVKIESSWPSDSKLQQLQIIDQQYFPYPWTLKNWQECKSYSENYLLGISHQKDTIQGFSLFNLSRPEKMAHLLKILVLPDFRGKGLSISWLETQFATIKALNFEKIFLEVESSNAYALKIYKELGFETLSVVSNYYGNSVDAVRMEKNF